MATASRTLESGNPAIIDLGLNIFAQQKSQVRKSVPQFLPL